MRAESLIADTIYSSDESEGNRLRPNKSTQNLQHADSLEEITEVHEDIRDIDWSRPRRGESKPETQLPTGRATSRQRSRRLNNLYSGSESHLGTDTNLGTSARGGTEAEGGMVKSKDHIRQNIEFLQKLYQKKKDEMAFEDEVGQDEGGDQILEQLQKLKNRIKQKKNLESLKDHEKRMLQLIHCVDTPAADASLDDQLIDCATEHNIQTMRKLVKTIQTYRLYQTSKLRKFTLQKQQEAKVKATNAIVRNKVLPDGSQVSSLVNIQSRNASQIKDLRSNSRLITDKYGQQIARDKMPGMKSALA